MWLHDKTRYKLETAILDKVHLKVKTLCYFMLNHIGQMDIESHLFEIIQFCFLLSLLLFLYLSVLLKPNFLKKKIFLNERIPGFLMHCHIWPQSGTAVADNVWGEICNNCVSAYIKSSLTCSWNPILRAHCDVQLSFHRLQSLWSCSGT